MENALNPNKDEGYRTFLYSASTQRFHIPKDQSLKACCGAAPQAGLEVHYLTASMVHRLRPDEECGNCFYFHVAYIDTVHTSDRVWRNPLDT